MCKSDRKLPQDLFLYIQNGFLAGFWGEEQTEDEPGKHTEKERPGTMAAAPGVSFLDFF
jgi:hypothetical protein